MKHFLKTGISADWGIQKLHLLVRDNASNLVNAALLAEIPTVGCYCHILHLNVHHAVFQQSGVEGMCTRLVPCQKMYLLSAVEISKN